MEYETFAALHEEETEGWVWIATPIVEPHRLIRVLNEGTHRKVYCECRTLDRNFVKLYNDRPHTRKIDETDFADTLVLNDWYRSALGIGRSHGKVQLQIVQSTNPFWAALRAGSQHPNPGVRLGNRLGMLGTWLGLSGIAFPVGEHYLKDCFWLTWVFVVSVGAVAAWACRGVRR